MKGSGRKAEGQETDAGLGTLSPVGVHQDKLKLKVSVKSEN